jgi:hypothetical protein
MAAAALAPALPTDPDVHADYPDAVEPPTLILIWDEPWLEPAPRTMGTCLWVAHLLVWCLAGRVEPGPGIDKLEELVTYTVDRLQADAHPWPAAETRAPRVWRIADVPLLGARIAYDVPVLIGGP